jgi:hypothetical protein
MLRSFKGAVGALVVSSLLAVGCAAAPAASQAVIEPSPPPATPSALPSTGPSPEPSTSPSPEPSESIDPAIPRFAEFDPSNFSDGAKITNPWLPLQPGRRWITEGETIEGGERIPHSITFAVTNLTKMIEGVRTVVVWIEDHSDGELVEKEIAFYAQDDDGTVWYFGEHPEEYEDGKFVAAPTWIAGLEDAKPGIKMFGDPGQHLATWYQGYGPKVEWSDFGRLDEHQAEDCVTAGCFGDVYRFAESSDGEQGIFQLKSYAKGVGEVRVGWRGEAESREELELKARASLKGDRVTKYDELARALEAHAYKVSPTVYGKTERMQ